ncbi:MAG TPA: DUF309 domain-containing protein [Armatimonadota bacterium]|nr:DUF309 domain-containing protein [Armatimonadota bacterium]
MIDRVSDGGSPTEPHLPPPRSAPDEDIAAALAAWAGLFNQGKYFEAHEVLEHAWLLAAEPDKTFLKGLIHAAVALYQYRRGNGHGARVKYGSCIGYLSGYHPRYAGVDVAELARQMDLFFAELVALPKGSAPPPPPSPWPRVPPTEDL